MKTVLGREGLHTGGDCRAGKRSTALATTQKEERISPQKNTYFSHQRYFNAKGMWWKITSPTHIYNRPPLVLQGSLGFFNYLFETYERKYWMMQAEKFRLHLFLFSKKSLLFPATTALSTTHILELSPYFLSYSCQKFLQPQTCCTIRIVCL